ncbi:hypothetical protein CTAYLR_001504 [Chrysophaeum taylorii]|uniref:UDP-N-acetylglucosamine--dolichyl-phosphate N-acetylglucosaminephosphotransferase n=1 Tax=Chrysophaeum taylorii TaxID=2483200 RepID=A0AAD7XP27_9STRA|nr:hypothetical protein CTAYLR_001504 [Chrysophaeum taylorii]
MEGKEEKWGRDVAMRSVFAANGKSWVPLLMGAMPLGVALLTVAACTPVALRAHVGTSCVLSALAFWWTRSLIPVISSKIPATKRGCDLLKRPVRSKIGEADRNVPESLGIVSGVALVCALVLTQVSTETPAFAHDYAAAMLCIVFAVLLGFVDDFLDLEWKYKYVLPPIMSLPLLSAYDGGTRVVPPKFCRAALLETPLGTALDAVIAPLFGGAVDGASGVVDLGLAYKIYMVLLAVFCTNAINIYAGVNGLECGQTYAIACAILAMSAVELGRAADSDNYDATKNHLFAVTLMLPFAATTLALLRSNWFPANVFVGDTFTNYAGMTLAVVAILAHFPIMLVLLMFPQLLNFLYSFPQLFGMRPCPRHRLPSFDPVTGRLRASRVNDRADLVPPHRDSFNLTLINAALRICGPLTEPALATILVVFQLLCCIAALALRFSLVGHVY